MSSVSNVGSSSINDYYSSIGSSVSTSTNLSVNSLSTSTALGLTNPVDQILFSNSALERLSGSPKESAALNPSNTSPTGSDSTGSDSASTLQALLAKIYAS